MKYGTHLLVLPEHVMNLLERVGMREFDVPIPRAGAALRYAIDHGYLRRRNPIDRQGREMSPAVLTDRGRLILDRLN